MKKILLGLLSVFCVALLFESMAEAVCPVCTIAIGAGLEGMRILGVKDILTGIWAGGLTVSLIGWTANYMHKHNVKNPVWYVLNVLVYGSLFCKMVGKLYVGYGSIFTGYVGRRCYFYFDGILVYAYQEKQ